MNLKRTLCALLAVLLLASLLPAAPQAEAAVNPGFQALSQYIRENGEYTTFFGQQIYSLTTERTMWSNSSFRCASSVRLDYSPSDNTIEIETQYKGTGKDAYMSWFNLNMTLNSDGSYTNVWCGSYNGEAHYKLAPASISLTTIWKAYEYLEGSEAHSRLDNAASTLLKEMLEAIQVMLKQKGRSIADLGYTAYQTGHSHKWDKGTVVDAPNCGSFGGKDYTCSVCKSLAIELLYPVGSHSWDKPVVTRQPSCTQEGTRERICSKCGNRQTDVLPALGHAWTYTRDLTEATEGQTQHDVLALYTCSRCQETQENIRCASVVFSDMPAAGNWAHAPIDWAYFGGLTAGKGDGRFAPNDTVTRAEVLSFLWTVAGRPAPEAGENPFTDVPENKYFYKPVMWAVARGITSGVEANRFGPGEKCTRGQIMTFLWIAAGRPEPQNAGNPFTDVPTGKYYYKPVLWAVENNVTGGTGAGTFSPNAVCTRAQVLAFLYKTEAILKAAES